MRCITDAKGCGRAFGILIKISAALLTSQGYSTKFDIKGTSYVKWRYYKRGTFCG